MSVSFSAVPSQSTLVLLSGGLDSAVLAAHEAQHSQVQPLYVRVGLAWEEAEVQIVKRLLAHPLFTGAAPLAQMEFTMRDVYPPTHWARRGHAPACDTPDEAVYLTGRNLVLLSKAGVVAATRGMARIVIGSLAGNPFPDATPAFFHAMAEALSIGLDSRLAIEAPFSTWTKEAVIRRGIELGVPFAATLSCMQPVVRQLGDGDATPSHCGVCSKCRERRDAFANVGVVDPATDANTPRR